MVVQALYDKTVTWLTGSCGIFWTISWHDCMEAQILTMESMLIQFEKHARIRIVIYGLLLAYWRHKCEKPHREKKRMQRCYFSDQLYSNLLLL